MGVIPGWQPKPTGMRGWEDAAHGKTPLLPTQEKFSRSHWKQTFPLTAQPAAPLGSRKSSGALEAAGKSRVRNHTQQSHTAAAPAPAANLWSSTAPYGKERDEQGAVCLDLGLGGYGRAFCWEMGNSDRECAAGGVSHPHCAAVPGSGVQQPLPFPVFISMELIKSHSWSHPRAFPEEKCSRV